MNFSKNIGLQLYVDNVNEELDFWKKVGFIIENENDVMGYKTFTMKTNINSTTLFSVYDKKFIAKVSPEVIYMKPSILFESNNIEKLQKLVSSIIEKCSELNYEPFTNFNFASPSGIYFAVKEV